MSKPSCEAPPLWLDSNSIWSESTVIWSLEEKELIFLAFCVPCPWSSQSGSPRKRLINHLASFDRMFTGYS